MAAKTYYNKRFNLSLKERILLCVLDVICNVIGLVFSFRKITFPSLIKKILVLKIGGLGDVLLVTPALKALKSKYPSAQITVLIPEKAKDVLNNNPHIDIIIPIRTSWWRDKKDLFGMIRLAWNLRNEEYDLGIDFRGDILNIIFLFLTKTKYRLGFGGVTGGKALLNKSVVYIRQQEVDSSLYLLQSIGVYSQDRSMFLGVTKADSEYVNEFLQKNNLQADGVLIGFHPSTPWKPRNWPVSKFAALGDYLVKEYNAKIIILGNNCKDIRVALEIYRLMQHKPIIANDIIDIQKMVTLIRHFKVFICNDSAPAHFAALTSTPTIVLFGPDDPLFWKHSQHIGIKKDVFCFPCRQRICKLEDRNNQCMNLIGLDEVIKHVKNILIVK